MRLYSTSESSRQGEPTVLAIIETLAAMAISVWIGVHFQTWVHIIIGACIAPLLLLRTDKSCRLAIRWFNYTMESITFSVRALESRWWGLFFLGIIAITFPIWFTAISIIARASATAVDITTNIAEVGRNIAKNWERQVIATDFATSPEILPMPVGLDDEFTMAVQDADRFNVYSLTQHAFASHTSYYTNKPFFRYLFGAVYMLIFISAVTLAAIAYRWSLKSTAIVWFPLLWALQDVKRANQSWQTYLEIERTLGKPALVAVASAFTLLGLGLKTALWLAQHAWATRSEACRDYFVQMGWEAGAGSLPDVITGIIRPGAIPLWQIATGINATLGLYLWWQIRTWLAHYQHGDPPQDESVAKTFAVTMFFRRLLTSYTILCNGYIAIQAARKLPIPEIGSQLFPFV